MANVSGNQPRTLAAIEQSLCQSFDAALAEARRAELRTLYEIGRRLQEHKTVAREEVRASLVRCGQALGRNRTTLLRYAFVALRIAPEEFEVLIGLSDARGYPATFWDIIAVAELSRDRRRQEIEQILRARFA